MNKSDTISPNVWLCILITPFTPCQSLFSLFLTLVLNFKSI